MKVPWPTCPSGVNCKWLSVSRAYMRCSPTLCFRCLFTFPWGGRGTNERVFTVWRSLKPVSSAASHVYQFVRLSPAEGCVAEEFKKRHITKESMGSYIIDLQIDLAICCLLVFTSRLSVNYSKIQREYNFNVFFIFIKKKKKRTGMM